MKIPWWQWLPLQRWRIVATVDAADEIPSNLPRNGAVLVGTHQQPKWVAFDCPCRSGHRIMLNADGSRQPHWKTSTSDRLTLSPSIDFHSPHRRCHYFIRNGRVEWVHGGTNR